MECEFRWIPPEQIGDYWQTIKPGLAETAEKAPGGWTPGDVFLQLANGQATLHIALVNQYYRGFMVSKVHESHGVKKLIIWIAHGDGSGDLMQNSMGQLREWAKNIGAAKIQMQSGRKGWERIGARLGFRPTMTIYEMDI